MSRLSRTSAASANHDPAHRALVVGALALALAGLPLAGCASSSGDTSGSGGTSADAGSSSQQASSDTDGMVAGADGSGQQDSSADGTPAGSADASSSSDADGASSGSTGASSDADGDTSAFSLSDDLNEDGTWKDVDAASLVTLPDYSSIPVPADAVDVAEAVSLQVDALMASYATSKEVTDRAVEDGDTVNIDYTGYIDGIPFDGGSTHDEGTVVTIGVTQYIPGFLDQLVGHTPGETFDIDVTFPEDYGVDALNGRDAVFSITVNSIIEAETPELTDEFVQQNFSSYGWSTADEMYDSIESYLSQDALESYVISQVVDGSDLVGDLPTTMVDYQEKALVDYYDGYAQAYGMTLDDFLYLAMGVTSTDELIEDNRDNIDNTVKRYLVYEAIAGEEGLTVTDEDARAYFEMATARAAQQAGATATMDFDEAVSLYGMPYLKLCALQNEVIELLVSNSHVEGE